MRKTHKWTDEERDIIRRDYQHTRVSLDALAKRLGVSPLAVRGQVTLMGIAKRTDYRAWSGKEKERLAELAGHYSIPQIARKMHRSRNAVKIQLQRLEISLRVRDGWFTKKEVSEILGHDHKWVQKRIDCGAIKATYHYGSRPTQIGLSAWHIEEKDLKEFIRRYPEELTGSNVDMIMIVDILVGVTNNNHR